MVVLVLVITGRVCTRVTLLGKLLQLCSSSVSAVTSSFDSHIYCVSLHTESWVDFNAGSLFRLSLPVVK